MRCQDVRKFRETEGLAAQRLIRAGTPVGIAFENHRPVRSEGHVPANKDKVETRVVRSFDVAQRGIPIGQYAGIIRTKLTVLIDRTVLRRRRHESTVRHVDQRDTIAMGCYFVG